jgi:hypothetical protein
VLIELLILEAVDLELSPVAGKLKEAEILLL